jgi:hypothetical protein
MTLDEIKQKLAVKSDIEVARALNISQQAVSLWRSSGSVPLLRQYQIREKLDEL